MLNYCRNFDVFLFPLELSIQSDQNLTNNRSILPSSITSWFTGNNNNSNSNDSNQISNTTSSIDKNLIRDNSKQPSPPYVHMTFTPYGPNGETLTANSPAPVIQAKAQYIPKNQIEAQLGHTLVNGPNLDDIRINPQDIQFTVPNLPDSVGLKIIEQIQAQLGTVPITLGELNKKFVTFTAEVPGLMINRTIVANLVENSTQEVKTTRTKSVQTPTAYSYQQSSSYSTQHPPIQSYLYNPMAPVINYQNNAYKTQDYNYTIPITSSNQSNHIPHYRFPTEGGLNSYEKIKQKVEYSKAVPAVRTVNYQPKTQIYQPQQQKQQQQSIYPHYQINSYEQIPTTHQQPQKNSYQEPQKVKIIKECKQNEFKEFFFINY